ncbi:MAG: hypothetical protein ACPGOV_07810 [Magnetovibrionaceae bacterium]
MRPLFGVIGLVLVLVGLYPGQAGAQSRDCPLSASRVQADLKLLKGPVRYDFTRNTRSLRALSRERGNNALPSGWLPTGLTLTETGFSMRTRAQVLNLAPGRYCAVLNGVEAELGHEFFDVFVVNKYRPGSCEHQSILRHEERHVAIFRDVLRREAPDLRRALETEARRMGPIIISDPNQAAQEFQRRLRDRVMPLFKRMNERASRENARLDTPENYRREQRECSNW